MSPAAFLVALLVAVSVSPAAAQGASTLSAPPAPREWTLEEAVAAALAQHPLVEAAVARVAAARGERDSVAALPNPAGTLWLENVGYPGRRGASDLTRETSLYVTYPIEALFQRGSRVRRADEDVVTAESLLQLARRRVAADTARAFSAVALAQVLHQEAEQNLDRFDQLVAYNRVRVQEGVTAERELLRLEIELDRAANDLVLAEVEFMRARAGLAPYLGEARDEGDLAAIRAAVPPPAAGSAPSMPPLDVVLAMARERRPELLAGRARSRAAAAATDYERTLVMRQVGATFGNKRAGGLNSMVAAVTLTVPLFSLNGGGIARATSERISADHELSWMERTITTEVRGGHAVAARLTTQLTALQGTFLERAESVHRLTLGAYQEGGATLLQVLDATRMLADARLAYSRTLFAQREGLFELALATGSEPAEALDLLRAWSPSDPRARRTGDGP